MKVRDNFGNAYEVNDVGTKGLKPLKAPPAPKKKFSDNFKLGLNFIFLLIGLKLVYLLFETYYNGYIIDIVSSTEVAKNSLDRLELLGNNIASVGITLLLMPLFYIFTRRFFSFHKGVQFIALVIVTAISFYSFKQVLHVITHKIVEANHDKRYESYYIEMFKYGMLTGKLGYTSFIPKEHLDNLSVSDKIIISNLFLLTNFDQDLITKFVGVGKEKFFDIYVHKYFKVNYRVAREQVEAFAAHIEDDWTYYNSELKKINASLASLESPKSISKAYTTFTTSLNKRYDEYRKNVEKYTKDLDKASLKAPEIYGELKPLFNSNGRVKYKIRYEHIIEKYFGMKVDASYFKKLTKNRVLDLIEKKSLNEWKKKNGNIALNLTQKQFFLHPLTKKAVVRDLHAQGIKVSSKFNYSKKQFTRAYTNSLDSVFTLKKKKFKKNFFTRTGHKNVKLGLSHPAFVSLYKNEIMQYNKRKDLNLELLAMLQKDDLSDFYTKVFKPTIRDRYYDRAFPTANDFETNLVDFGNQAIEMLYIPPFAITMSMVAGMLNFISLLSLILLAIVYKREDAYLRVVKPLFKVMMLAALIFIPYNYGVKNQVLKEYPLLQEFKTTEYAYYISLMNWLLTVESFNYRNFYIPIKESNIMAHIMSLDSYEVDLDEATQNITGLNKK